MLKGVNKLIIEVSNPESEFFERAIFFVKPEKGNILSRDVNEGVMNIMGRADSISAYTTKPKGRKKYALLKLAGAASMGAVIMGVVLRFLGFIG